jgi:hypothetical protein
MKRIPTQQKLVLTLLKIVASMLHFTKCFILFMLNGVRGDKKNGVQGNGEKNKNKSKKIE